MIRVEIDLSLPGGNVMLPRVAEAIGRALRADDTSVLSGAVVHRLTVEEGDA